MERLMSQPTRQQLCQQRKIDAGVCRYCSNPATVGQLCEPCNLRYRDAMRKRQGFRGAVEDAIRKPDPARILDMHERRNAGAGK